MIIFSRSAPADTGAKSVCLAAAGRLFLLNSTPPRSSAKGVAAGVMTPTKPARSFFPRRPAPLDMLGGCGPLPVSA